MDEFFAKLGSLPASQQERVTELMAGHLTRAPKEMHPPLLKALHGTWRGVYQFELGQDNRLLYEVDSDARVVRIVFLGHHPQWDRRRPFQAGH
jgi:mRNA-degrading endonuclease RelE of RelBE toxin-antitoxin system